MKAYLQDVYLCKTMAQNYLDMDVDCILDIGAICSAPDALLLYSISYCVLPG